MYLHEYQAKQLLSQLGVLTLVGRVAHTAGEAVEAAKAIGEDFWVVKAQIHAGGRGKAGGIILAHSLKEVEEATHKLLHKPLVTVQTSPSGELVKCVYVEQGCDIEQELYVSLSLNRREGQACLVASQAGGISIEEVARKNPEAVVQILIDPFLGIQSYHLQRLRKTLLVKESELDQLITNLYHAYIQCDASLIEINPLVVTNQGKLVALDAKVSLDDNALYRQLVAKQFEPSQALSPAEETAQEHGFSYVKLEGDIACMVNGAGLAMAMMDLISFHGGKPANFLDIGGGADQVRVQAAFRLITSAPHIKVLIINIFGGIVQCDMIATSIVAGVKEKSLKLPIVVRLEGTHSQEAKDILLQSGLAIIPVNSLAEAAQKAVQIAAG